MSRRKDITNYCIEAMLKAGIQKAQCTLRDSSKDEFNVDSGEISLLRTTNDTSFYMMGIIDDKRGSISINKTDTESIDRAVKEVHDLAESSEADDANDISELQPSKVFRKGPTESNFNMMYDRITAFLAYSRETYPSLILEQAILDFVSKKSYIRNSNGVYFESYRGIYNFSPTFTSKDGAEISSFNYSGFSSGNLDRELHEYGSIDTLMRQSTEQTSTREISGKFTGEIIITPDCMDEFLSYITMFLSDYPLISGTSIYMDSLNELIADPQLTLHSRPVSDEIADGYFFTSDGYEARNSTIIENGVLKTFLLSLYGANKTGKPKAVNNGDSYIIDAGRHSFEEMVSSVKKGILMCRFSGGNPSDNGDFSGVCKNSYYIENGEILYPVRETMISGNLGKVLKNIRRISKERIDFGSEILPWIQVSNITISGK